MAAEDIDPDELDIRDLLLATLDQNHGETFRGLDGSDDPELNEFLRAARALSLHAYSMLGTGRAPHDLEQALGDYLAGDSIDTKVRDLFNRRVLHDYLEYEVAYDVVDRLRNVRERIGMAVSAYQLLRRSNASPTAEKYLRRAVSLFLAGYEAEMVFMCGAAVEQALEYRFPDTLLRDEGIRPTKRGEKEYYMVSHRMRYAQRTFSFTEVQRDTIWRVLNWRNDVAHVQLT